MNIEGAETAALVGMRGMLHITSHVIVACHDFKKARGESPAFATYDDVRQILIDHHFLLRRREDDQRPYVKHYLYGARGLALASTTPPAHERDRVL
jgi:hypothetical protein